MSQPKPKRRTKGIDKVQKRQNYDAVVSNMLGRQTAPLPIMAKSISMLKSKANSARTAVEMKSKGGEGGVATAAAAAAAVVATPASSTNPFEHPGFQEGGNPGGVELLPPPYITPSPSTLSPSPPTSLPSAETRPWHSLPLLPDMSMPVMPASNPNPPPPSPHPPHPIPLPDRQLHGLTVMGGGRGSS